MWVFFGQHLHILDLLPLHSPLKCKSTALLWSVNFSPQLSSDHLCVWKCACGQSAAAQREHMERGPCCSSFDSFLNANTASLGFRIVNQQRLVAPGRSELFRCCVSVESVVPGRCCPRHESTRPLSVDRACFDTARQKCSTGCTRRAALSDAALCQSE